MIDGLGIGGAESHLISLLNVFDFNKYKVDLLLCRRNGVLEQYVPKEVKVLPVPGFFENPPRRNGSIFSFLFCRLKFGIGRRFNKIKRRPLHHSQVFWRYYRNCFENLSFRYDFAVAFGQGLPCYFISDKVIAEVKLLSINTDLHSEGYIPDFDRKYFSSYSYILPVTQTLKEILIQSYKSFADKMCVFENTFNIALMKSMAHQERAFTDGFTGIRIISIGRLVPAKGFNLAIKAAFILKRNKINFRWYLVGDGFLKPELEKLINNLELNQQVIITGRQLNPFKYYNEANIYVQTSLYEGFCRTIKEAKVFNLPIVTTNFSVVYEQIVNGQNGLIVEINEQAIAEGIIKILSDQTLRNSFICNLQEEYWCSGNEEFGKFEKYLI